MAIFRPLAARNPQRPSNRARRSKVLAYSADDPDGADKPDELDESDMADDVDNPLAIFRALAARSPQRSPGHA